MRDRRNIAAESEWRPWPVVARTLCALLLVGAAAPCSDPEVEWRSYGGDDGNTKYSPVSQIDPENVGELGIVWRRPGVASELADEYPDLSPSRAFLSTPLMVDGVLYASNAVGLVEAFDPATGETLWIQELLEEGFQGVAGRSTRGVAFWGNGANGRVLAVRGDQLISLNPETGMLDPSFGDSGRVDLTYDTPHPGNYGWRSPPIVVGDVVVIGGCQRCGDDFGDRKEHVSEDVRGYDVSTGEHLWTFHVVPRPGEFGHDTWGGGASGAGGAWVPLAADPELGYVYLPLGSPYSANYGGHRPGENLFANSLVALDVETGERVWHYQLVHHDLWDYDPASAPILGDITVDGRPIRAVMQLTKAGFVFAFDRVTGEPVWPIEERPVPASTTPGEQASPTQPFPSKPPPFDRQGVSVDDLIDFTPELRAEALEIAEEYDLAPLYTPPTVESDGMRGTLTLPGATGAANWNGGAFDPETGMLYVMSHTHPWQNGLVRPPPDAGATIEWIHGPGGEFICCEAYEVYGPDGLPLVKPPYARITAFDMNSGDKVWEAPNGDGPRDHPRLRHLNLPPLGSAGRGAPLLTRSLLFAGEGDEVIVATPRGGGGNKFRAFDKVTGRVLWETELPAGGTTGAPITYIHGGRQYIVVATSGSNDPPEWIAFALP